MNELYQHGGVFAYSVKLDKLPDGSVQNSVDVVILFDKLMGYGVGILVRYSVEKEKLKNVVVSHGVNTVFHILLLDSFSVILVYVFLLHFITPQ